MAILFRAIFALLILLSLAAGGAKLMQMPQEIEFFARAGLGLFPLITLGLVQVAGGVLAMAPKTRLAGVVLIASGFLASAIIIAANGNLVFGAISLIPAIGSALFTGGKRDRKSA